MINGLPSKNCIVQPLESQKFNQAGIQLAILRLDLVHPVISGNKWFKLRYYFEEALASGKAGVLTFGGAHSNHVVATAAAAKQYGIGSRAIIRGEQPKRWSATLEEAAACGMQIQFASREAYRVMSSIPTHDLYPEDLVIPAGGYGVPGRMGAEDILHAASTESFQYILCACGTGTMLAGLITAALPHQHCIGISVLKGHHKLAEEIIQLLPAEHRSRNFTILHDFHLGGYAKKNEALRWCMNRWYADHLVPTDFVYTGKLIYAAEALMESGYFSAGSKVLLIHSGGLQGNRSLPEGWLSF